MLGHDAPLSHVGGPCWGPEAGEDAAGETLWAVGAHAVVSVVADNAIATEDGGSTRARWLRGLQAPGTGWEMKPSGE